MLREERDMIGRLFHRRGGERTGVSDERHGIIWRFYGREKELGDMDMYLKERTFAARVVHGRRGIGKTFLLREAGRRCRETGGPPTVLCELPSSPHEGHEALERFREAVRIAGVGDALDDLPARDTGSDAIRFRQVVEHIIHKRINVVIDEFHYAKGPLESNFKIMIDRFKHEAPCLDLGTLFVMGSHQQKMRGMFRADRPLGGGRMDAGADLKPWPVSTVFEMAEHQGLLERPDRFLTLWTAFGGMPDQWQRFVHRSEFDALRNLDAWPEDGADWRMAFIEAQRDWLERNPDDLFDRRAYVELAEPHRDVLLWLAHRGRAKLFGEFPQWMREREAPGLKESLDTLDGYLGLAGKQDEYQGNGSRLRWGVTDHVARFQIDVLRVDRPDGDAPEEDADMGGPNPMDRLRRVEGLMLERLAAETFDGMPGVHLVRANVRRYRDARGKPVNGDPPDMDLLVQPYTKKGLPMVFGECKRDAGKLFGADLDAAIDRFMALVPAEGKTRVLHDLPRRKLLIAPTIPENMRETLESGGTGKGGTYECMDIPDMVRMAREQREKSRHSSDRQV